MLNDAPPRTPRWIPNLACAQGGSNRTGGWGMPMSASQCVLGKATPWTAMPSPYSSIYLPFVHVPLSALLSFSSFFTAFLFISLLPVPHFVHP